MAPLRVMVDELVRAGIGHAVVAPGSRNAPIVHALADRAELTCWSVLDERQAGYFALGIAKSTGIPAIITCTSGTAAANLHPAVVEADHAGVPLIVLTADRPPELRDVGAGQAIDQIKLFGTSVRWFVEAGNHPLTDETLRHFRALASRVVAECAGRDPGPVHINLPLREPLQPVPSDLGDVQETIGAKGRPEGRPWTTVASPPSRGPLLEELEAAERPLFVLGEQNTPGLAAVVAELAECAGIPVLADALSQMRRSPLASAPLISAYDLILRSDAVRSQLLPDLVVRIGATPTSKHLRSWLSELQCRQIVIDPRGRREDPTRNASEIWSCASLETILATSSSAATTKADDAWVARWSSLETAAQESIDAALADEPFAFEPAVIRAAILGLDGGATIFVSSSMPVRDLEAYGPVGREDLRYLSNRGANGIDGVLSTALGSAAPWTCDRTIVITGDLAFLYDSMALSIAARYEIPVTILCLDNAGGGIFSFLPISQHEEHFEELIATPPAADVAEVAAAHGLETSTPKDRGELIEALKRPGLVRVQTDRSANLRGHQRVAERVIAAVESELFG